VSFLCSIAMLQAPLETRSLETLPRVYTPRLKSWRLPVAACAPWRNTLGEAGGPSLARIAPEALKRRRTTCTALCIANAIVRVAFDFVWFLRSLTNPGLGVGLGGRSASPPLPQPTTRTHQYSCSALTRSNSAERDELERLDRVRC
jgi:hypothetical protein